MDIIKDKPDINGSEVVRIVNMMSSYYHIGSRCSWSNPLLTAIDKPLVIVLANIGKQGVQTEVS